MIEAAGQTDELRENALKIAPLIQVNSNKRCALIAKECAVLLVLPFSIGSAFCQGLPPLPVSPLPVMDWAYDSEDRITTTEVASGTTSAIKSTNLYNSLGYLREQIDSHGRRIKYENDGMGRVTSVTAPNDLTTKIQRNGFGEIELEISPDSGTTAFKAGVSGDIDTVVDSRGVTAKHEYDALGRLTSISYAKAGQVTESYSFGYDNTGSGYSNGIGRLTRIDHPLGSARYLYDPAGRLIESVQSVLGTPGANSSQVLTTAKYLYDAQGRLNAITYPSGRRVVYTYAGAKLSSISLAKDASTTPIPLLSQIKWEPFGPVKSWKWEMTSGASTQERSYDTIGRIVRYKMGGTLRDITYDTAGRIDSFKHYTGAPNWVPQSSLDQNFKYDENGRLTEVNAAASSWSVGYDANGNRTSMIINGILNKYQLEDGRNRLASTDAPKTIYQYDDAGNLLSDTSGLVAKYNLAGRMSSASKAGLVTNYGYDSFGNRLRKFSSSGSASTVIFMYDQAGRLLGEYSSTGVAIREYIWMGDTPVSMFVPDPTLPSNPPVAYFIHADHLNAPRLVVNRAGQRRWRWLADPFGVAAPETNPDGVGVFVQNLRFPGQYADVESSLFYNGHRNYDPSLGRYTQSDPIGLAGGVNTYLYANANPLSYVDPNGLETNVTVWQPVGWGSSSFGHVSTDINGTTYSWGPGGMSVLPTADYLAKNGFRDGMGLGIRLTPQQEEAVKACLSNPRGEYSVTRNNCGTPIQDCLKQVGVDTGNQTLPVSLGNRLIDMGIVNRAKDYPASRSGDGRSAPWAR